MSLIVGIVGFDHSPNPPQNIYGNFFPSYSPCPNVFFWKLVALLNTTFKPPRAHICIPLTYEEYLCKQTHESNHLPPL